MAVVDGSVVIGHLDSLQSYLDQYKSEVDGLNSHWKGPSHDSLVSQMEEFLEEYKAIISQMESFSKACDLYNTEYEVASQRRDQYIASSERATTDEAKKSYADSANLETEKMNALGDKIRPLLSSVSSLKLVATSISSSAKSITAYVNSLGGKTDSNGDEVVNTEKDTSVDLSGLDMVNYPTGHTTEDGLARAVLVAEYLEKNGGFSKSQAAALAGVYMDENGCYPGDIPGSVKATEMTYLGSGYGAGIASWTGDVKNQVLNDAGYSSDTLIENLSLQQQCDLVIASSNNSLSYYYNALRRCDTIEDASATAVLMTGGPGFSSHWDTHPIAQEAKAMADAYGAANDRTYGASSYHWNADQRRLDWARQIYSLMQ